MFAATSGLKVAMRLEIDDAAGIGPSFSPFFDAGSIYCFFEKALGHENKRAPTTRGPVIGKPRWVRTLSETLNEHPVMIGAEHVCVTLVNPRRTARSGGRSGLVLPWIRNFVPEKTTICRTPPVSTRELGSRNLRGTDLAHA